ncbi:ABC transporter permease [Rhizobium ruizarguesonis]|uniref:ABC transporter permease n=1 Tax=Rhizobium ruizarguesonis TaxID=2081791 RepID=A0AB38I3U2_9HYPH|nr:ABC transporter permease [Rhizobium ruizarguesonis]NEJ22683.1 ABC transporter permease subunit [Rhizobium leguminosarum]NKK60807.1 ABC transporter permease subunit [Rhizobium leguminosarum bv. viciae]TAY92443.1 ABC transporter permease [Rhizobium ruizarguesonis]TBC14771.1 ABC transporter permease [Rhizobium ruizarguesonis]TCA25868.1 ABC transporter permease [Rhizobium leguminosarum bv. viciae]
MFKAMKLLFAVAAIIFLIAPLLAILPLGFTSSAFLNYPIPAYSTRWFEELVTADAWRRSIVNSLIVGSGTTVLATALGMAASLGLRNRNLLFLGAAKTLFLLPMVVPAVVLGVGMQVLFVRVGIASSYIGVIIAHTVVATPFVVVSITGALAGIDRRIELAAESLGAVPLTVFRRVTLPLAMPGVLSGAVLAFATSLDEVVLTLFVAGPNQRTLARQMFSTIRENISPAIAAAAFVFIAGTILIALLMYLVRKRYNRVLA